MNLTERDIIDGLRAFLWGENIEDTMLEGSDTSTFEDGGYLTYDEGFILDIDGHRFQITVKQER